jgi:predicted glycosyltransferase
MQIIFYCQYVWGMGHLVRSLEFAKALAGHEVTLVVGGRHVDIDLPGHVELVRLPAIYMDEAFTTLIAGDGSGSVAQIQETRREMLFELFERKRADIFIIELFPFGRSAFDFELDPLLNHIHKGRYGDVRTVCSLRDILVEKKDPSAYEQRVVRRLNADFDLLMVHSDPRVIRLDETFGRIGDIAIPVIYTGFIAQQADGAAGQRLRRELKISGEEKLIVASAGGGRSGYPLLRGVLDACYLLGETRPLRLEIFTGPFMEDPDYQNLAGRAGTGFHVQRYTDHFLDYLNAADLSISLAGYNTCMNLLVTRTPALVYPYSRQREQPLRAAMIKNFRPMKLLNKADIQPANLSKLIAQMLQQTKSFAAPVLNLDGAANAARYLSEWLKPAHSAAD